MNDKPKNIEEGLVVAIANSDVKSIGIDIAEISLDAFLKDGLAKDIPVVSWLFAGYKIYDTISDRILGKKILNFLSGVEEASQEKRQEFITSLEDPKKLQEVGEQLLLMISKYDDFRKAKLLGYFFAALTEGEITIDEFYRIATIIDKVYFDDFKELETIRKYYNEGSMVLDTLIQSFLAAGLLVEDKKVVDEYDGVRSTYDITNLKYKLQIEHLRTEIGDKFIYIYKRYINV